jgi:polysaccharide biosynthesis protein PslF
MAGETLGGPRSREFEGRNPASRWVGHELADGFDVVDSHPMARAPFIVTPTVEESPRLARAVALVGTFPPTRCGIATFTSNLRDAICSDVTNWRADVVRVMEPRDEPRSGAHLVATWTTGDRRSLDRATNLVNEYDAVLLQHEFGIFGGPDGDEVLDFVDALRVPLVVVLHTALSAPSSRQREIVDRLVAAATRIVVQSDAARRRIVAVHECDPRKIMVIAHGATANFADPKSPGATPRILTWGLLGPGKGVEFGIRSVARLLPSLPSLSYVVAGKTHPKVLAHSGEGYRESLRELASSLGAGSHVLLDDGYRDWGALRALVRACDVVLLPYLSHDQVSSGVLVEALASGKPVVATRFAQAEELLSDGAGLLVDHGDVDAMTIALRRVFCESGLAERMARRARAIGETLLWPRVGATYRELLSEVITEDVLV